MIIQSTNQLIRKCKALFKKTKLSNDEAVLKRYKCYRNSLNRLILHVKQQYYEKKFEEFRKNSNVTWSILNRLCSSKVNRSDCASTLKVGGTLKDDPSEIVNCFNTHFSTVYSKTKLGIKTSNKTYSEYLSKRKNQLPK